MLPRPLLTDIQLKMFCAHPSIWSAAWTLFLGAVAGIIECQVKGKVREQVPTTPYENLGQLPWQESSRR
jgi:hypothetical protein